MIKMLPSSLIYLLLAVCFVSGAWLMHRIDHRGEVRALNERIQEIGRLRDSDLAAQEIRHEEELRRAGERVTVREVIRHVKDVRSCDVPADVVRVLDARLQGIPPGTDPAPAAASAPVAVSQRQALSALDDLAERFHACRGLIAEWNSRIAAREKAGAFDGAD